MKNTSQSGYTLIDLLLASAIMLFVFTVFGAFYLKVIRTTGEINETTKRHEDAGFSATVLRNDLERTGHNLTVQNNQSFAGNLRVPFAPHPDYTVSRTITRNMETTGDALQSAVRFRGNSELNFTGSNFNVVVKDAEDASRSWGISRQLSRGSETVEISESRSVVRTVQNAGVDFDVPVKLIFSSSGSNADFQCLVTFWQATRILHQSRSPCTPSFKTIALEMPSGSILYDTELSASEVVLSDDNNNAVRLPLMPFYDDVRMMSPVVQTSGGFLILSGDVRKNVMNLTQDALIRPNDGNQTIFIDIAAALRPGDVLFIADFFNQRSVLLAVETVVGNILTVKPLQDGNYPGFDKLRSRDTDFAFFTFQRGIRVVKIAAPVEYRVGDGGSGLYRRTEGSAWDLVLPSAANFTLLADNQPSSMNFEVSFDVANEGIEAQRTVQNVRFSINPRALNRVYDVR
ncbi:MAG: hypothetical protein LH472_04760 [Pyrinomonadaceae bacterium]|nr:hypothetical protein [Pyrinomonadaceae bacterium]